MTKIKICGLRTPEHIQWANQLRPDYIGFVFAPSRRRVTHAEAAQLKHMLDDRILAVGVFVDARQTDILELAHKQVIDLIQLHGNESTAYINTLRTYTDLPIIKALRSPLSPILESPADYLLLDGKLPGSGQLADWSAAQHCKQPFFLAGGLHAGNLETAILSCSPFGVDLSSGVEIAGQKDRNLIAQVIEIAHRM
ncbi:phosphoribosylanthranilate isomerase [Sphaerochaeta sp.]|uniref:phosphoribosylanthranilate isomerase n=1 Tax=Sphaerochaeta sp. TaxID=1972642 RepID=UPI002FCC0CF6